MTSIARRLRSPRAAWLAAVVAVVLALGVWSLLPRDAEPVPAVLPLHVVAPIAAIEEEPLFTFVSMPDFLNTDIGDTRARAGQGWDPGDPISTNATWTRALDVVLDQVQVEKPAAVLVAGDLVYGHWGIDVWKPTGIFGPVATRPEKLAAVTNAGNLYYGQWASRFTDRGLRVLPAVGDHEIGDNPWPEGSFDLAAVPTFKKVWAGTFTRTGTGHRYAMRPVGTPYEDTAYAVRIANTLLVTVDVFKTTARGVEVTVDGGQLRWLDRLLGRARRDGVAHIIVQGHTPVLGPVRSRHSSDLMLSDGDESAFWQLLDRYDVDLYLAGEMHDMTTLTKDGVVQVVHGALAKYAEANYLLGRVFPDRIELTLKQFRGARTDTRKLWNTDRHGPPRGITFEPGPDPVGTMVIDKSGAGTVFRQRTGRLVDGM